MFRAQLELQPLDLVILLVELAPQLFVPQVQLFQLVVFVPAQLTLGQEGFFAAHDFRVEVFNDHLHLVSVQSLRLEFCLQNFDFLLLFHVPKLAMELEGFQLDFRLLQVVHLRIVVAYEMLEVLLNNLFALF